MQLSRHLCKNQVSIFQSRKNYNTNDFTKMAYLTAFYLRMQSANNIVKVPRCKTLIFNPEGMLLW
jgi:hypothetical protein